MRVSIARHRVEVRTLVDQICRWPSKNIRLQMGRCPVRHIFGEALALLKKKQDSLSACPLIIRFSRRWRQKWAGADA